MTDEGKTTGRKKTGFDMWNWKRRFTLGGVILALIALILIGIRGYNVGFLVLLIIGVVIMSYGVVMKSKKK